MTRVVEKETPLQTALPQSLLSPDPAHRTGRCARAQTPHTVCGRCVLACQDVSPRAPTGTKDLNSEKTITQFSPVSPAVPDVPAVPSISTVSVFFAIASWCFQAMRLDAPTRALFGWRGRPSLGVAKPVCSRKPQRLICISQHRVRRHHRLLISSTTSA
jgi:hypothetical protein